MVRPRLFPTAMLAGVLATAAACSTTPSSPTFPSSIAGGESNQEGGATLKVNAPDLVAPAEGFAYEAGSTVRLQFAAASGLYVTVNPGHEVVVRNRANGQTVFSTALGVGTLDVTLPTVAAGDYEWQVRGASGQGRGPWSAIRSFRMLEPPPPPTPAKPSAPTGNRTPDPAPGQRLPLPDRFDVVAAVASSYPHFFFNSCQEHGGSWDFMDTLVDILRLEDTRWGYGWKRGVVGDPLMDLVTYNWSSEPDEGTRNIYTVDVIGGHCGSFPSPVWNNTQPGGGPGQTVWTGRGRF